jgi:hypothetical protein
LVRRLLRQHQVVMKSGERQRRFALRSCIGA